MCIFSEIVSRCVRIWQSGVFNAGATFTQKLLYSNVVFLLVHHFHIAHSVHCAHTHTHTNACATKLKINRNSIRMPSTKFKNNTHTHTNTWPKNEHKFIGHLRNRYISLPTIIFEGRKQFEWSWFLYGKSGLVDVQRKLHIVHDDRCRDGRMCACALSLFEQKVADVCLNSCPPLKIIQTHMKHSNQLKYEFHHVPQQKQHLAATTNAFHTIKQIIICVICSFCYVYFNAFGCVWFVALLWWH